MSGRMKSRKLWSFLGLGMLNLFLGDKFPPETIDMVNKIGTFYLGAQGVADLGKGIGNWKNGS